MDVKEALEAIKKLKHVDMEHRDRERWEREWRRRTAEQILREGVVWGCRDVAVVLKHLIGERARIVEGVRILAPGGHVWIEVDGKYYDANGEFNPVLSVHGPYATADMWEGEEDPVKDWEEWKRKYLPVKLAYEAVAVAYTALEHDWLFIHTERVVYYARMLSARWEAIVAGWLHDVGYVKDPDRHREVGAAWAREWLKRKELPEESIELVVDGILNHGTRSKPETDVGHALRLADALAVWDPIAIVAWPGDPRMYKRIMEKKWGVIEEYERKDLVKREKALRLLDASSSPHANQGE